MTIVKTMRPAFLLLTPACVSLGIAAALFYPPQTLNAANALLILIGALCAHIGVNVLNEYFDFISGLDLHTLKTPFSGGSGALPANPRMATATLLVGAVCVIATMLIGIYLIALRGFAVAPIGILGIVLIVSYTPLINRVPWLCLIAPGLGFGPLMIIGTYLILNGECSLRIVLLSLIVFCLVNNLLLLNQYPDIEADRRGGRRHLPIAYGIDVSNMAYAAFFIAAELLIISLVACALVPDTALFALLAAPLGMFALYGALRHGPGIGAQPRYLAANVGITLITPIALAAALWFG
jgi:1,4-dihydroxy-2-naphthoate octaprenyltransferase